MKLEFYVVTMKSKKNQKLYISMHDIKPKWTFNFGNACYWDTEYQANKWAKSWFKTFKSWKIEKIEVNI